MLQADRIRIDDAFAQRGVPAPDDDLLVEQRKTRDVDRRHVVGPAADERFGIEGDQAFDTAEIDDPLLGFVTRLVVELVAQQAVGNGIDPPDAPGPGIEQRQPPVGRDPEIALVVLDDLENDIAGHSVGRTVTDEGFSGRIEPTESRAFGGEPYLFVAVLENTRDIVVRKRIFIACIVQELGPDIIAHIVEVDAVRQSSHPEVSVRILPDVVDHLAAVDLGNMKETVRLPVVILQSVHGSHVDAPAVGLAERKNVVAEKTARFVVVIVFADTAGLGVDHPDTVRKRTHPQIVPVHQQPVDIGEIAARSKEVERPGRGVERVKPGVLRTDPEPSVVARANLPHAPPPKAVYGIGVVVLVEIGIPLGQVVDAPEERTDPQSAFPVFVKRVNSIVRKRIGIVKGTLEMLVTPGADVVNDDSRLGPDPQLVGRILEDMPHEQRRIGVVRQPQAGNRFRNEIHLRHTVLLQSEIHPVVVAQADVGDDVLGVNLLSVGVEERLYMLEPILGPVEAPAVAGEPDDPVFVGREAAQGRPRFVTAFDQAGVGIVAEDIVIPHDDPDAALPVAVQNRNRLGDRLPVVVVKRHGGKTFQFGIIDVKPRVCADPYFVIVVLDERFNEAVPQSGFETGIVHEGLERLPVVAAQSVFRAEPHEALIVLDDRGDRILR